MIKLLQKRFVITAMIAISLLIVLLLGAINITNIVIVRNDIDRTLIKLTESPVEHNIPNMPPNAPMPNINFNIQNNENRLLSSPYFLVVLNDTNSIIFTDVSHISSISEDEAKLITEKVLSLNATEGKIDGYRYKMSNNPFEIGTTIAFLDASNETYSYIRVMLLSAGVGIVCWTLMLILVIVLSKKAIRPIAENLEKQKEFITNAGHEIKTPLAIIQANTDAMELYGGENKWSKNIKQQVTRLDGLMKNLLFLTRSDENGLTASKVDFSFSKVVYETAESFIEPLSLKDIQLQTSIQEDISINGDKEQITQLVSILLDNALKYTNENGYVALHLSETDNCTHLHIKNTVTELPKLPPERLFERFYRGDSARTQKSGGYGIGLSMAKAICEANGAQISVCYESPQSISFNIQFK